MSLPLITSSKPLLPLLLTECLCPPKILVKILPSNVMVLRDGAFGRQLGHEGGLLMHRVRTLTKKTTQNYLGPSAI